MTLVDSHCHLNLLDLEPYDHDLAPVLVHAHEQGIEHMLSVSVELNSFSEILAIAEKYSQVSASVGVHPNETHDNMNLEKTLIALATHPKVIAIGETGLDYYRSEGDLAWQHDRFRQHIRAAKQVNKPLIIHTRQAREDTLRILREENATQVGGVMHCFTESWEMAQAALDLGFYISFSGIVTFNNAKDLQEIAKKIDLDKMLIETDAPYLAPVPYRGKSNLPGYVKYTAEFIAQLRGISFEALATQTTENFYRLFF